MSFMDGLKAEMKNEKAITTNGAVGYATSGKHLLDLNFQITSLRKMSEKTIASKFVDAFFEDKMLAMKWLFYVRDAREGIGERRTFRAIMKYLAENNISVAKSVITLIPEYGRFDDVLCLLDTELKDDVITMIKLQLN